MGVGVVVCEVIGVGCVEKLRGFRTFERTLTRHLLCHSSHSALATPSSFVPTCAVFDTTRFAVSVSV